MPVYGIESYGDHFSSKYDNVYAEFAPYPGQIELLHRAAGSARALELGVGTGRIAFPLARAGTRVLGIDSSQKMLDVVAARRGALPIETLTANATDFHCGGERFNLVFAIFNFLFLLPGRAAQLNCFRCVRDALTPGGQFVIETFVPITEAWLPDGANPGYFPAKSGVSVRSVTDTEVSLFTSVNDGTSQTWRIQEILLSPEHGVRFLPCVMHYLQPAEIDALARKVGFKLAARSEDWNGTPFGVSSRKHISVYTLA